MIELEALIGWRAVWCILLVVRCVSVLKLAEALGYKADSFPLLDSEIVDSAGLIRLSVYWVGVVDLMVGPSNSVYT